MSGARFMFVLNQTILTAAHAVSAIQAFVAGAAAYGDMSAGIAGRCIALHALGGCIHRIQSFLCLFMGRAVLRLYRGC